MDDEFACPCGDPLIEPLSELLDPFITRARDGELAHAEAEELASGRLAVRLLVGASFRNLQHAATLSRAIYQNNVSWFLFSSEWLDALAAMLKSHGLKRVLEVAAGCGVLAKPMRQRGHEWRGTD